MPKCKRCGKTFSYLEDEYCEVCGEYLKEVEKEKEVFICYHCNKAFSSEKEMERHRWSCYHRFGYVPKVKKKKR